MGTGRTRFAGLITCFISMAVLLVCSEPARAAGEPLASLVASGSSKNYLGDVFGTSANDLGQFDVTLDASGSVDPDGSILQYRFVWGDGSTAEQPTPVAVHGYGRCDADGTCWGSGDLPRVAYVEVQDNDGQWSAPSDSITVTTGVDNHVPVITTAGAFVSPTSGPGPLQVQANLTGLHDPDANGAISYVHLDWGDGTSAHYYDGSQPAAVDHTFLGSSDDSQYQVCLTVGDDQSGEANSCTPVNVSATPATPTLSLGDWVILDCGDPAGVEPCQAGPTANPWAPVRVAPRLLTYDENNAGTCAGFTYRADWDDDGTWDDVGPLSSCDTTLDHTFGVGTYNSRFQVTDETGLSATTSYAAFGGGNFVVYPSPGVGTVRFHNEGLPDLPPGTSYFIGSSWQGYSSSGQTLDTEEVSSVLPAGNFVLAVSGQDPTMAFGGATCTDPTGAPTATGSSLSGNVASGETVDCTFHWYKPATAKVKLVATPSDTSETFDIVLEHSLFYSDRIANGQIGTEPGYAPGSYTATMTPKEGWILDQITCDDSDSTVDVVSGVATYVLDADETVMCTFYVHQGEITTASLSGGQTLSSDNDGTPGATPSDAIETSVKLPANVSGTVTIDESKSNPAPGDPAYPNTGAYDFLGWRALITAPPAPDPDQPLEFTFVIDRSLAEGNPLVNETTIQLFRDGTALANCASPCVLPCVSSRTRTPGDDFKFTIMSDHASTWDLAVPDTGNTIWGTITDPQGNPVTGIAVAAYSASTGALLKQCASSDADGVYACDALPDGTYRLRVSDPSGVFLPKWLSSSYTTDGASSYVVSGSLKTRWNARIFRSSDTGTIRGQVLCGKIIAGCTSINQPRAGLEVRIYNAAGRVVLVTATDASGNYVASGLEPGNYTVRIGGLSGPYAFYLNANTRLTATKIAIIAGTSAVANQKLCGSGGTACN